jgi:hypothetical protein
MGARENLFEIIDRYQGELSALNDLDLDEQTVLDTVEALQGDIEDKLRAVVAFALQLESDAKARAEHAKRMLAGAETLERRAESLLMYAQVGLMNSGLPLPVRAPEFTLNLAKLPPSCEVTKPDELPESMVSTVVTIKAPGRWYADAVPTQVVGALPGGALVDVEVKPDKRAVLAALKAGPVAGAKMNPAGYRLTVK